MVNKSKKIKPATLRNKADRLLQELGRYSYDRCAVCGGEYSCLHHFIPKSLCSNLRYDWDNLVPVCHGCHFSFHTKDDPAIYEGMVNWLGLERMGRLKEKRKKPVKTDSKYYGDIIDDLLLKIGG
jgi:5-methylcytosine-specific restriction endonuclease McrA